MCKEGAKGPFPVRAKRKPEGRTVSLPNLKRLSDLFLADTAHSDRKFA
jgi:hypothetical protein